MPRALPVDRIAYRRALRTSRLVTAALAAPVPWLMVELLTRAGGEGQTRASAGMVFFILAVHLVIATAVLVPVWRRSYRLRPVVLHVDASHAERIGVPELDEPAGPHRGLSGQVPPPTRW